MLFLMLVVGAASAQSWRYASVRKGKAPMTIERIKLVPFRGERPLYLLARDVQEGEVSAWNWLSDDGGILRLYGADGARVDSAVLTTGQERLVAIRNADEHPSWRLGKEKEGLQLRPTASEAWVLERILAPVPGTVIKPDPVTILRVTIAAKRRPQYDLQVTGNLQSMSATLLDLAFVLSIWELETSK